MSNPYCEALGIRVPALEALRDHPEASSYSLLLVALLERGGPMTLPEVAKRFAEAGVAPEDAALRALKRCRPARPPVYRDGDHYALDLWAFRLGLRPAKSAPRRAEATVREEPAPLPAPDVPLTVAELDEA